ncbi:hypothetical protein SASPL_153681 [Salvia splendens]|uniref:Uncharacterized protein n=1 Tax=Salvia splendens TaxID=180675 RepID=A0A8X8VYQ8_SALSN|nr:hypothetical protein SASPL_153681 [Salvia splendens]
MVQICNYPFTTRGILMGHINLSYQNFQVTDTPGLLRRHDEDRNNLEKLTLAVLSHLPTAVLFVHDLSGECGTSPSDQFTIYNEVKERFASHLWLDVVSKSDLLTDSPVVFITEDSNADSLDLAKYRRMGPDGSLHVSVMTEVGIKELKARVHELLVTQSERIKSCKSSEEGHEVTQKSPPNLSLLFNFHTFQLQWSFAHLHLSPILLRRYISTAFPPPPFNFNLSSVPIHILPYSTITQSSALVINNGISLILGLKHHRGLSLRSTTSEEISADATAYVKDDSKTVDEAQPVENTDDYESRLDQELQEGSLFDNPLKLFKFLEGLNIKLDYEETYSFLAFGSGGAVALWLVAAIVSAIDSIPVLPKALELVGLGYTLWFSSRYLVLKKNRDELFARVEELKQQVLGSDD